MKEVKNREIGIDLFRIIATFFVVLLHVLGQGGILENCEPNSLKYLSVWFLETLSFCAVNCFALISGYIMVGKQRKLKNIFSIWFQAFFYSVLLTALVFLIFPEHITLGSTVKAFIPVLSRQWWYISSYFVLFFVIPYINMALDHLSKKDIEVFLIAILICVGVIDRFLHRDPFTLNHGYSGLWLIILYIFGAYIKKYDIKQKITATKSILLFFGSIVLTFLSKFCLSFIASKIPNKAIYAETFISYTSITIVLASIFLFLFCLNVKINTASQRIIGVLAPTTLGIYLIHVHPLVFKHILKNAFVSFTDKSVAVMIIFIILAVFAVFLACLVIELIRIQLFKIIKVNKFCEFIDCKIQKYMQI